MLRPSLGTKASTKMGRGFPAIHSNLVIDDNVVFSLSLTEIGTFPAKHSNLVIDENVVFSLSLTEIW